MRPATRSPARSSAVGPDVVGLELGQQVCVEPNLATGCGVCAACIEGRAWFCRHQTDLACWGFAESMIVPARSLLSPSAPIDPAVLTLVEPLACAFHALRSSWTATALGLEGKHVAVVGAGRGRPARDRGRPQSLGAGRITSFARHPHQALAAKSLGADRSSRATSTPTTRSSTSSRPISCSRWSAAGPTRWRRHWPRSTAGERWSSSGCSTSRRPSTPARRSSARSGCTSRSPTRPSTASPTTVRARPAGARAGAHWPSSSRTASPLDRVDAAFELSANKSAGALRVVVTP